MSEISRWNVVITTPMGENKITFDFVVTAGKLSGKIIDDKETNDIYDGQIEGNTLTWGSKVSKPLSMKLKFTATVDGDSISGGAKSLFGTAPFIGTRS
jgi:hypothetical protein